MRVWLRRHGYDARFLPGAGQAAASDAKLKANFKAKSKATAIAKASAMAKKC